MRVVRIPKPRGGEVVIGAGAPLALIGGPCVVEGLDFTVNHAKRLAEIAEEAGVPYVFKASFDKANRTSAAGHRGPGVSFGLEVLAAVKETVGLPILTDVHLPDQCAEAARVADVLQIPAFLCRQTDLLVAASETGKVVNVKKGQFMAPEDMGHAVTKCAAAAAVLLTERGSCFGYRDLVVDMRSFGVMRKFAPVVFDGTHSVQKPGSLGGSTGGDRTLVPPLVRAAVAVGVDAIFLEVHPDPDRAPSDGPNSLDYPGLVKVLREARTIESALRQGER
ncbi:MAG: 3-deoxy-8-phosphooctulonate synthase [Deltaproteobacteria bacterium]|nr:3-deoxy-8-phosphooctulonate synthase [Deltaproteobacteria bacterium]